MDIGYSQLSCGLFPSPTTSFLSPLLLCLCCLLPVSTPSPDIARPFRVPCGLPSHPRGNEHPRSSLCPFGPVLSLLVRAYFRCCCGRSCVLRLISFSALFSPCVYSRSEWPHIRFRKGVEKRERNSCKSKEKQKDTESDCLFKGLTVALRAKDGSKKPIEQRAKQQRKVKKREDVGLDWDRHRQGEGRLKREGYVRFVW